MMKLKNMIAVTEEAALKVLENWEHDEDSLKFFRASSNFVCTFKCKDEKFFLRFSHEEDNDKEGILAEVAFMQYLSSNQYPCAELVKSLKGNYMEEVETDQGTYYAVVFTEVKGEGLELEEMTEQQFESWGKSLGKLHLLSKDYRPKNLIRKSWKDMIVFIDSVLKDFPDEKDAQKELISLGEWLNTLAVTESSYGLIHYDFELDNIFWNEEAKDFGVIDFDDAMYHWFAMDITCALLDLNELEKDRADAALKQFMKGYNSVMHTGDEYVHLMPQFLRFSNLVKFARILRSLKDSNFEKAPAWVDNLKSRLSKKCEEYREGFRKLN